MLGEIKFDGVGFQYDEFSQVLQDINFHCNSGQSVAILGPTGSGKTTLVNLLPRFYEYNQGSLTLDGRELNTYSRKFLRENIGVVEQEPFLFSRTIRENITYGVARDIDDQEIEQAAKAAAIHDVILDFPEGYNTLVGEKGVTLSGGQKQRIAIARTLLKDPCILIFDDSTSSVDPETEGEIREALQRLMEGRTTFIIAHRIQSVRNADMIIVLDKGRIVQMGTHDDLMSQDAIYRQVHDLQTQIELELEREISGV
jgi:ATP-binding cassette subfamily B protein